MTEKQRMTNNEPGDEYGENSKSSGRQRDLPCDAAGITGKGYSKTTRNAYGEPSPVHPLGPDRISAVDCGYIFEDLVRRFSESFGEEAGAHFTSRDIIYLMTDLLLSGADMSRQENITLYESKTRYLIQFNDSPLRGVA